VTTVTNAASAIGQLGAKLAILRETVNKIHNLYTEWRPTPWRPSGDQMFYQLQTANPTEVRYICFFPTDRLPAPPGVVLYELHVMQRPIAPVPVPVPADAADRLKQAYQANKPIRGQEESWARRFVAENPKTGLVLRGLAYLLGAALVIAAIVLIFDPVPGDEAAAGAAAMAVLAFAAGR
jgi:hypothetical protein